MNAITNELTVLSADASTWSAMLPTFLAVLQDGDAAGRRLVVTELQRMAAAADIGNQALVALVRVNNRNADEVDAEAAAVIERARTCGLQQDVDRSHAPMQFGKLAKRLYGKDLELQICYSAAGFYLGTYDLDSPCTRESAEYWSARELAARALGSGKWTQRERP